MNNEKLATFLSEIEYFWNSFIPDNITEEEIEREIMYLIVSIQQYLGIED